MTRKKPKLRFFLLPARTSGLLLVLALLISLGFGNTAHAAAAPTLVSISPATGSTAGGDSVIISGNNFASGDTVAIGGNTASNITVVNSTTITATTPAAGSAGSVDVTVTDTSSQTATLPGSFTYTASNLISWWKLDGNANDSSGSGFNGTVNGATATTDRFGTASGALSFNGTSNYLDMGNVDNIGTGSLTVSAWFKTTASSSGVTNRTLVAKSLYGTQTGRYSIVQSGGSLQGMFADSSGAGQAVTTSETPYLDGVWHQVTMVYDHSGSASLYVDGVLKGSKTMTGVASANMTNSDHLFIGAYENSSGTAPQASTYFSGSIDDVRVYNRALSQSEVTALYDSTTPTISAISPTSGDVAGGSSVTIAGTNFASGDTVSFGGNAAASATVINSTTIVATAPASSGVGTVDVTVTDGSGHSATLPAAFTYTDGTSTQAGLISWWKLNGNANDSTLYARNGTVNGATPTTGYDGTVSGAYSFNGSSNYINMGNVDNMGTGSLTVSAWFKTTKSTVGGGVGIVAKSLQGSAGSRYFINQTGGNFVAAFDPNGSGDRDAATPETPYIDGYWHLITAVYDRTGNESLYIDGVLKASTDMSAYAGVNMTSSDNFYVGVYNDSTGKSPAAGTYFNGSIDDVRVYSRALSASEVAGLYNVTAPGITGITPASGSTAGGDSVTITGTNFVNGDTVSFGGNAATNVTVVNATTITATTPVASSSGAVDVVVRDGLGNSATLPAAFTYNYPTPSITAVSPTTGSGNGGTGVTITGTDFNAFDVSSTAATANAWASAGSLATSGQGGVTAIIGSYVYIFGTSSGGTTTIQRAPTSDPTTWTNVGTLPAGGYETSFAQLGQRLYLFGGTAGVMTASAADPTTWSIVGSSSSIAGLSDASLAIVGDTMYLFGGIVGNSAVNTIYTAPVSQPTQWTLSAQTLPAARWRMALVRNSTNLYLLGGGSAVNTVGTNTIYSAPLSDPTSWSNTGKTLPSLNQTMRSVVLGDTVYLLGGLNSSCYNTIYSAPLSDPTSWSNTGKTLPSGYSNSGFAVVGGYMYLFGGSNCSANVGTIYRAPLTQTGSSLYNPPWMTDLSNPLSITFGGTAATNVQLLDDTHLFALTPAHAAGTVDVVATDQSNVSAALASSYTYNAALTVTGISPASGAAIGGDSVTISGTNFTDGATVSIGGNAATNVTVVNSTTITATTPVGTGGSAADVVVTNPDSTSATLAGGYYYKYPPPTISSLSFTSGDISGGDRITITGTNFYAGDTVSFGGNAATNVSITSTTTLLATVPAAAGPGAVDVTVTDNTGQADVLAGGYTYTSGQPVSDTWVGGDSTKPTDWWTADNWSRGKVPGSNDDAVIDGGANQPTLAMTGPYTIHGLSLGATTSSVLTVTDGSETNGLTVSGDLSVGAHGTVTTSSNTDTQVNSLVLSVGGDAAVASGGALNVSSKGYSMTNGPGGGTASAGGSYGGVGGASAATAYGAITQPTDIGSGGGNAGRSYVAGVGGGAVHLTTSGSLTIDGTVSANGQGAFWDDNNGGGSGGSVWIAAGSLAGNGSITANGGGGTNYGGDGGGGGRVAMYYDSTSYTGTMTAHGGGGSVTGGAGTVYTKSSGQSHGDLLIDNNGTVASGDTPEMSVTAYYDNLTVTGGSLYRIDSGKTVTTDKLVAAKGTGNNAGSIQLNGTLNVPDNTTLTNYNVTDNGTYSDQNPILGSGTTFSIVTTSPSQAWQLQTLTINNGGTLTTPANSTSEQYAAYVSATGNITVAAGGIINEAGLGYAKQQGPGAGTASGVGGTYGGVGANSTAVTYGSKTAPINAGSGGYGATGGGIIRLDSGGSTTIDGTLNANGASASSGGGAGGSIWITANAIGGSGTITANGGGSVSSGGGGGRIAFTYNAALSLTAVTPGTGTTAGGDNVTLSGTGLPPNLQVQFGGNDATVTYVNDTTVTAVTPASLVTGPVAVTATSQIFDGTISANDGAGEQNGATLGTISPDGGEQTASLPTGFTYMAGAPVIDSISPQYVSTAGGTTVTITGANFFTNSSISLGGQLVADVTYVDANTLTFVTAAHAAGALDVTVANADGNSTTRTAGLQYDVPPAISGVTPSGGATTGGDMVTITGNGFALGASVSFGGVAASTVNYVSATTLTAEAPAHAVGAVDVTVTNTDNLSATYAGGFTYKYPPPSISSLSPTAGRMQGGTTVTFTGSGFTSGLTAYFDGVAATTVGTTSTTLTVKTPAGALGDVDVTVSGPQTQTATAPGTFRYAPDSYAFTSAPLNVHATEPGYITIEARDKNGSAVSAPYDITLALTSSSSGGSFSTDSTNWGVTNVTIPAGQSSVSFYYKDANKGTPSVTATGPADVSVSQTETITSRYILLVTGVSDPIDAGVPSSVTVQATDWQGVAVNDYTGTVHFSSDDNYASLPTDFTITSDMRGHHTFVNGVTLVTTGEHCVTATDTSDSNIAGQQCNITVNGGYSGAASKLVVITDPQSTETSTPTAAITVQVQDSNGNPAPVPVDTTVYVSSSSGSGSFSTDGVSGWSSTQPVALTIKANTTSANVYYQDSSAGTKTLSFKDESSGSDGGLTDTSQSVYIGAGAPAALAMSVSGSQPYGSWVPVRVSLKDSNGVPATNPDSALPIYFTSDNSALQFSLDSAGNNPASSLTATIPVGGNQTTVYVHASDIEAGTITASDASPADGTTGLDDTAASINFIAHDPSKIVLSTNATTGVDTPVAVTITQTNDLGQPAGSSSDSTIALSDANHGGSFSLSDTTWQPVDSVTLPAGSSSVTVYYKTTTAGNVTLDASGLSEATTSLTVTPGAYTQLVFTGGSSSVPVTEATGFSVTAEDMYGNVTTLGSTTPVYLYTSSGSGSFAASSNGPWSTTSVNIPAGGSSANFYYKDTNLHGTAMLTVSDQSPLDSPDSGITNASRTVNITGETASKLVFTTSPQTVAPGHSSRIITVQAQTSSGQPAIQGSDLTISLSSNSTGSYSFTASTGSGVPSITKVTIPAGGTSASFYYSDTKAGTHTLSASSGSLSADQGITISASVASQLTFVTPAQSGQTNQPSQQIEIGVADTYGNATTVGFDTTVGLSSSCSDSSFSLSNASWSPVTQITIPAGSGSAYFYFKTSSSSCQLSISADNLDGAAQQFTAATGPAKIALSGLPASLEAGQAATVHVSLEDTSGNLVPALSDTALHVFASGGTADQSTVTVPAGSSSADIQFTAGATPGSGELQVRDQSNTTDPDTGLIDAAASTTITAPVPSALSVTPASANASVSASKQLTVTLTNAYGITATATTDIAVNLATTGNGSFTATSDTAAPSITSVTIPTGSSTATVYYHQTDAGSVQLTMSGSGLSSGTATLAFLSGDIASYQFMAAPSNAEAGQTVNFGLQALDQYGNVVTLVRGQHIYLASSTGGGTFGGGYYYSGSHSLIVPNNATSIGFSYKDNTPGSDTITASDVYPPDDPDSGIINAIAAINITSAVPAQLVFTSSGGSFERGGVSNQISVQVQSNYGLITPLTSNTTFTLTSTSPTGQFALSNAGPWTLKQLTIPAGSSSGAFYYRNNTNTGSQTIHINGGGLTAASQSLSVLKGAPASLYFVTPPQTLYATHTSPAIEVGVNNRYGYPTVIGDQSLLSLSTTSATAQFANILPNWGASSAPWAAGAGSASFRYRDSQPGSSTITAHIDGLLDASQPVTVLQQVFDHFLVTNISDPQQAGTPSSVVVIAQDAGNYTVAGYNGTIHFTSSDPGATLPADYTFQPYYDKGLHTFTNGVIFALSGEQTVTVTDTASGLSGAQQAITVLGGDTGGTTNPGGGDTGTTGSGSGTNPGPSTGSTNPGSGSGSTSTKGGNGSTGTSSGNTGSSVGSKTHQRQSGGSAGGDQASATASGGGFGHTLGEHIRRILHSPATPYVVPGIFYFLVASFAAILLWDMYREIKNADLLLKILKRERRTAEDKTQFLNLVAHHARTPVTIIAGGAELIASMAAGDRFAAALSDCTKRLQTTVNDIVESIANQVKKPDEAEPPAQAELERKLYLAPLFWAPIGIGIGLTWLINWLATAVGHQDVHGAVIALQLLVAALAAALLYSALRGRHLRSRRKEALERSLEHRRQLDDGKNAFITSIGSQLAQYTDELQPLNNYFQQNKPAAAKPLNNGVNQLQKLVETMQTLSSISTAEVQTGQFKLGSVLDQALLSHNQQIAGKQLDIATDGADQTVLTQDQRLLGRVTDTLLDNAIAFSPSGGKIAITANTANGQTAITVSDNGPGLPKVVTDQLLQPFTHPENTLNETHQGLGLSLYLDSLIMRHLGGSLRASSSARGTTITLEMPSSAAAS